MFGDSPTLGLRAEELLKDFTLEELLEMNNLTEQEVIELLLEAGLINDPERYF